MFLIFSSIKWYQSNRNHYFLKNDQVLWRLQYCSRWCNIFRRKSNWLESIRTLYQMIFISLERNTFLWKVHGMMINGVLKLHSLKDYNSKFWKIFLEHIFLQLISSTALTWLLANLIPHWLQSIIVYKFTETEIISWQQLQKDR